MSVQNRVLAERFIACWKDQALKARFMADPMKVLQEHGLDVPDNLEVKVFENADDCVHTILPIPPIGVMVLSDDELSDRVGGGRSIDLSATACW